MARGAWWATVHGVVKSREESDTTERLTLSLSILCLEGTGCPEHGRMFSSTSGLCPLGGSSQPPPPHPTPEL